MKFLMDTDHISFLQRERGPESASIARRRSGFAADDVAFPIVSLHEQALGCHNHINNIRKPEAILIGYEILERTLRFFSAVQVLPFDAKAQGIYDNLVAKRVRVGTMDLRIASIALSRNLTLLTRNVRDFGKVPGLLTEDWTI